jgi:hypothetical protein
MRKISLILLSMGALLALSFVWQGPASAQNPQMNAPIAPTDLPGDSACWGWGDYLFGQRIAGSYLNTFAIPSSGATGTTMTTLAADGTGIVTPGNMFAGVAGEPGVAFAGPYHTVWERTGWREITWRHMFYGYNNQTGEIVFIIRADGTTIFDEDFGGSHGDMIYEVFAPDQLLDPLDPNFDDEPPAYGSDYATFESKPLLVP